VIQLSVVVSFIPSVQYFIFRRQQKYEAGTFIVEKWPWFLVGINIIRDSSLLAVYIAKYIVSETA
jgi:hypothetical protein